MTDHLEMPSPAPFGWRGRLASKRKIVILGGLLVILLILGAVAFFTRNPLGPSDPDINTSTENTNTPGSSSTNRTFERFQAVVNRPTTNTPTNLNRPTKEDTAEAIRSLTNTNPR